MIIWTSSLLLTPGHRFKCNKWSGPDGGATHCVSRWRVAAPAEGSAGDKAGPHWGTGRDVVWSFHTVSSFRLVLNGQCNHSSARPSLSKSVTLKCVAATLWIFLQLYTCLFNCIHGKIHIWGMSDISSVSSQTESNPLIQFTDKSRLFRFPRGSLPNVLWHFDELF